MKDFESLLAGWLTPDPFYEKVFQGLARKTFQASLRSKENGWVAGLPFAERAAEKLGLNADWKKCSGDSVREGEEVGRFQGTPEQVLKFENLAVGLIAKPSGMATAARRALQIAAGRVRLVSGGWKKHPFLIKAMVWEAVQAGGLAHRLVDGPFLYLDKNFVRIFGGIAPTLKAVASSSAAKVIQLRGEFSSIAEEAREALSLGAQVLMVDTGSREDLDRVLEVLRQNPGRARLAFAGGIKLADIPALADKGVHILDIGRAILDAPWLELSYDVLGLKAEG